MHRAKHYADLRRRPQPRWIEIGKHQPPWWWRRITGLIERGAEPSRAWSSSTRARWPPVDGAGRLKSE